MRARTRSLAASTDGEPIGSIVLTLSERAMTKVLLRLRRQPDAETMTANTQTMTVNDRKTPAFSFDLLHMRFSRIHVIQSFVKLSDVICQRLVSFHVESWRWLD